jgi:hypothetical protein
MSRKSFASAPKPVRQPTAEEIEGFEATGRPTLSVDTETRIPADTSSQASANPEAQLDGKAQSQIHENTEIPEGGNTAPQVPPIPEEPIVRLTIDLPESVHTRFKAVCAATRRKMVQEVRIFIERRTGELESENRP